MTLFEAIRQLKEGQGISAKVSVNKQWLAVWQWGEKKPRRMHGLVYEGIEFLDLPVHIIDLPKPKKSLKEGLYQAAEVIPYELLENPSPLQFTKHFIDILRSLPIDWQAEADRKEGE